MKAKLDENLPLQIALLLRTLGHDVHTTQDEGLSGANDRELWDAVQREARTLITQDLDFSDRRGFAPGTHHGIMVIRLRLPSRLRLLARLEEILRDEAVSTRVGCFVVVTDQKVRVRRPPIQPQST